MVSSVQPMHGVGKIMKVLKMHVMVAVTSPGKITLGRISLYFQHQKSVPEIGGILETLYTKREWWDFVRWRCE